LYLPAVRIGLVAHGDYTDEGKGYCPGGRVGGPHVLRSLDFSRSKTAIKAFLDGCQQTGGGAFEECYELVLRHTQDLSWRGARRALILVGDSIPHPEEQNPTKLDWQEELQVLTQVYGVEVSGLMFKKIKDAESEKECEQKQVQHFWQNLTKLGHGELFEQTWSVASQDSDFAQTAKLFDLFCLAHAGKEQLEKHIKDIEDAAAERGEEVSPKKRKWVKKLKQIAMFGGAMAAFTIAQTHG